MQNIRIFKEVIYIYAWIDQFLYLRIRPYIFPTTIKKSHAIFNTKKFLIGYHNNLCVIAINRDIRLN